MVLKHAAHANVQALMSTHTHARYEASRRSRKNFLVFPCTCSVAVMPLQCRFMIPCSLSGATIEACLYASIYLYPYKASCTLPPSFSINKFDVATLASTDLGRRWGPDDDDLHQRAATSACRRTMSFTLRFNRTSEKEEVKLCAPRDEDVK